MQKYFIPKVIKVQFDTQEVTLTTTESGFAELSVGDREVMILDKEEILGLIKMLVQIYAETEE